MDSGKNVFRQINWSCRSCTDHELIIMPPKAEQSRLWSTAVIVSPLSFHSGMQWSITLLWPTVEKLCLLWTQRALLFFSSCIFVKQFQPSDAIPSYNYFRFWISDWQDEDMFKKRKCGFYYYKTFESLWFAFVNLGLLLVMTTRDFDNERSYQKRAVRVTWKSNKILLEIS